VSTAEVGTADVGTAEVDTAEVDTAEVGTAEAGRNGQATWRDAKCTGRGQPSGGNGAPEASERLADTNAADCS
jgi:hypothetical protein